MPSETSALDPNPVITEEERQARQEFPDAPRDDKPAAGSGADGEQRLSPWSPLFLVFGVIKSLLFPLLVALVTARGLGWQVWSLLFAIPVIGFSLLQYWVYRYRLTGDQLIVREGVLFKNVRNIPYRRIQNLNLVRNPFHRLLGVAKVQIESASGGKPEAIISVLSLARVQELADVVDGFGADRIAGLADQETPAAVTRPAFFSMSTAEVIRYGIISNRGLVPVGILLGLLAQTDFVDRLDGDWIRARAESLQLELDPAVFGWQEMVVYGAGFFLSGLIILWLLSISLALLQYHGFMLRERNDKLSAEMGLLTRLSATIPRPRIQLLSLHRSPLHRVFRRITVSVETAGGVNDENQGIAMKLLAPLLPVTACREFLSRVQPDVDWGALLDHNGEWQRIEQRGWKRLFKVQLVFLLISMALLLHWFGLPALVALVLLPFMALYCRRYVAIAGYLLNDQVVAFRSGVLFHHQSYVRLAKIQTIKVTQSPFDRRHGMARLSVDTAGAALNSHRIHVVYLDRDVALALQEELIRKVRRLRFEW